MKNLLVLGVLILGMMACEQQNDPAASKTQINGVLDDWHEAAAAADFERYFNHFASDSAIFMGTDATERWTIPEFKAYAKPHFDSGDAWNFTPVQRHVYLSDEGETAWFDEVLGTPNLGPARGTGVLVKQDTTWRIAHYNLSIPIPNAIADTVIQQIEQALNDTTQNAN
ncbi:MAG: nuclear transport factor 2 family protein [Balneolaceae bacterium]|nr:nuclear transport factor 2 family protein [Balneolaceae bacterium]